MNNVDHDRMLLSAQSDLCLHCCLLGHHSLSEYIVLLWYVVKILGVPHFIVEMFLFLFLILKFYTYQKSYICSVFYGHQTLWSSGEGKIVKATFVHVVFSSSEHKVLKVSYCYHSVSVDLSFMGCPASSIF